MYPVPRRVRFGDKGRVHIAVADAVGNDVETGLHHSLRIGETEEMGRDLESTPVSFVDERGVDLWWHVVLAAVEPRLDEEHTLRLTLGHQPPRVFHALSHRARPRTNAAARE